MAKPVSFVRLDIARFGVEVGDRLKDADLGKWTRSLYRSLALGDPSLNEFGAYMLSEAAEYRAADKERKSVRRNPTESGGILRKPTESGTHTDIKTEQTDIQKEKKVARSRFTSPTLSEVSAYCLERQNTVDPQKFLDHYESNGWRVGKNPMKDWKAAVRTWEKNDFMPVNGHHKTTTRSMTRKGEHDENLSL